MNFTFGNTSANTSGVGNSLFGPANTTSAFGAGNTNAAGTSVFAGTNTSSSGNTLFGTGSTGITATTSTASSGFGSGGNTLLGQASTSTPNLFGGTNSFSINSNPNATSAFGIGGALSGAPTGGFGTTATSGAFGSNPLQTAATTNLGAFGATSQSNNTPGNMSLGFASTGGFNAGSTLGSTFNAGSNSLFANKPATGQFSMGSIGQGFGSKPIGQMNAAQPLQQQQQQQQREVDPNTFIPKLFNDERDRILGEFNKLQAYWGIGKGFFAPNVPPVLFNSSQSTHKFKAIGFSEIKTPTVFLIAVHEQCCDILIFCVLMFFIFKLV